MSVQQSSNARTVVHHSHHRPIAWLAAHYSVLQLLPSNAPLVVILFLPGRNDRLNLALGHQMHTAASPARTRLPTSIAARFPGDCAQIIEFGAAAFKIELAAHVCLVHELAQLLQYLLFGIG